jgi:hypothetical protein
MKIRVAIYDGNPVCNNQKQAHPHPQKPSQLSQHTMISSGKKFQVNQKACMKILVREAYGHSR